MAHDLLWETASKYKTRLIIIRETIKRIASNKPWFLDTNLDAGVIVIDPKLKVNKTGKREGFVWESINDIIFSCYTSPNISLEQYTKFLDMLVSKIRISVKEVIVAGDFNAKSPEWGSPSEHRRGSGCQPYT